MTWWCWGRRVTDPSTLINSGLGSFQNRIRFSGGVHIFTTQHTAFSCRSTAAPGVELIKEECQTSDGIIVENVGISHGSVCFCWRLSWILLSSPLMQCYSRDSNNQALECLFTFLPRTLFNPNAIQKSIKWKIWSLPSKALKIFAENIKQNNKRAEPITLNLSAWKRSLNHGL